MTTLEDRRSVIEKKNNNNNWTIPWIVYIPSRIWGKGNIAQFDIALLCYVVHFIFK